MRSAEVTILHLITSNFNHGAEKGPHKEFVYTPFQEGARRNFMGTLANSLKRLEKQIFKTLLLELQVTKHDTRKPFVLGLAFKGSQQYSRA